MSDYTPIIDFDDYGLNVEDISQVKTDTMKTLGKRLITTLHTFGYCYVKNHGVDENLIKEYFAVSRDFFNETEDLKEKYSRGEDYAFGWVKFKGEMADPKSHAGDLHEAFLYRPFSGYEAWPPTKEFETATKNLFKVGKELAFRFCDVLSLGLNKPKDFMRNAHKLTGQNGSSSAVKTLYFPPINLSADVVPNQMRIGEHIDTSTLSFIFQDDVGGLEIRDPNGTFVPCDPIPGTILVFTGALLQRWTSDDLVGTSHRIPIPTQLNRKESVRQSIVWFLQPDDDYMVECLDGSNKYEPIKSKGYLNYRIQEVIRVPDHPASKSPLEK